jgi:hypothetical protein
MKKQSIQKMIEDELLRLSGGGVMDVVPADEHKRIVKQARKIKKVTVPVEEPVVVVPPPVVAEKKKKKKTPEKAEKAEKAEEKVVEKCDKKKNTSKYSQFTASYYASHCKPKGIKFSSMLKSSEFRDAWAKEKAK